MSSLPPATHTYAVTVENRYGDIYLNWQTINLDATSEEEAKKLAEYRFPESWNVKAIRAIRHDWAAR
jgi:hypothetical protein